MTGHIIVKRLNKTGNYKSELDWDNCFIDLDNPLGLFKMVVLPITNCNGIPEVKYIKVKGGYKVSGEGYIVCRSSEKEIDKRVRELYERHDYVQTTEVKDENELW